MTSSGCADRMVPKDHRDATDRITERLGVPTPMVRQLAEQVTGDLDPRTYGAGWWHGHLDPPRRVLIADQLVLDVRSVARNLLEATLHRLEAEQAWAEWEERFRGHLRAGGDPSRLPPPRCPADELPFCQAGLHVAGVFRAVGSALDCLAGALIGVAALPMPILRADFHGTRRKLANKLRSQHPEWERLHQHLEGVIAQAGPAGWLDWAIDMRNMLVHRGRHVTITILDVREPPQLIVPPSVWADRVHLVHLLPRDPGRSQVEVMRDSDGPAVLWKAWMATAVEGAVGP